VRRARCCSYCNPSPEERKLIFVQENGTSRKRKRPAVAEALKKWREEKAKSSRLPFSFPSRFLTNHDLEALSKGIDPSLILRHSPFQKEIVEVLNAAMKNGRKR